MLEAALAGAIAGYAIAVPVGAIAVLIIHTGLTHGFRAGSVAAAGAATADLIYASIAALAGVGLAALIGPFIDPLRVVGGIVLIVLGVRGLIVYRSGVESVAPSRIDEAPGRPHRRIYVELLGLTLLNPATVIYFAALTVGLPFLASTPERLVFAAAAGLASFSWQVLLAGLGAALGRGTGHRVRRASVLIGNGVIIVMGALILLGSLGGG